MKRLIHSYAAQRAVMAILSFSAMILGARVLPPDVFGVLLQITFLAKFLQITNFGAASGYFVSRYSQAGPLAADTPQSEGRYARSYALQLAGISSLLLIGAALLVPDYMLGLVAFALFIPLFVCEPLFRYRRKFYFSLVPDLFLALAMWAVIAAHLAGKTQGLPLLYFAVLVAMVTGLCAVIVRRTSSRAIYVGIRPYAPRQYGQILRLGLPLYLGTAMFTLASSADRLFLPLHVSSRDINLYFLAHQLTIGAMLFVTSTNFVNAVDLGQARQEGASLSVALLWRKLRQATLLLLASIVILAASVYVLEQHVLGADYAQLLHITLTLAAGLGLFFLAGTVTPVLAYLHQQLPMTWLMGAVACLLFANNLMALYYGYSIFWLASMTSVAFFIYALVAIAHTFRSVQAYTLSHSDLV